MKRKILTIIFATLLVFGVLFRFSGPLSTFGSSSIKFTPNIRVNDCIGTASGLSSIAVGNNGYIFAAWADNRNGDIDIYFAKSTDGGLTFGPNVKVNDDVVNATNEWVTVAVDNDDNIYVTWDDNRNGANDYDIYFAKSTDGGLSFSKNIKVNDGPAGTWDSLPSMAVDDNGTIYITWTDSRADTKYDIYFAKSIDKGLSFNANVKVNDDNDTRQSTSSIAVDNDGNIFVAWRDLRNGGFDDDIYFARSIDGGKTFETNIRVNDDTSGQPQWCPSIAVDNESNVYVVWGDYRESRPQNVYFARSTDMGLSFDANIKVNDEKPILQLGSGFPSLAANKKNNIFVVWEDGRNSSTMADIYISRSTDGGLSFNKNIKVNDDIRDAYQGRPSIAVDSFGIPHVIWYDKRNGDSDIYFAKGMVLQPDLSVERKDIELDPPCLVQRNDQITINATIHNICQANASDVIVRFYDGDPSLNNQIGTDQMISFIECDGGIGYAEVNWIATPIDSHDIYVVVDPDNTIDEWDETNNVASKALEVIDILPPILYIKAVGDDIILNWTQPAMKDLSHYLIYRSTSQNGFDFSNVWVNTSQHYDNGTLPLRTTWNDTGASSDIAPQEYYYTIRTVCKSGEISSTSRTVGKWTKTFPKGVSTFSLPLEPIDTLDTEYYTTNMNAEHIKYMNISARTWMRHNFRDGNTNNTQMKLGESYEVKFTNQTNYTFTGMPGAMIIYDDDTGFLGFDTNSEAKSLTVNINAKGDVNLSWLEPGSMGIGDWYEVYYSYTRDNFFGTLGIGIRGIDYFSAYLAINFGTNTTNITGLGANNPGARLYIMVVPFNASGVRGASTYSIGIWTEEYLQGYDTFGIPLKLDNNQTADWYCDNIPDAVGINYYIHSEQRWSWHSTMMPAEAYDPLLVMTEGYQISTSSATKFIFIGR